MTGMKDCRTWREKLGCKRRKDTERYRSAVHCLQNHYKLGIDFTLQSELTSRGVLLIFSLLGCKYTTMCLT